MIELISPDEFWAWASERNIGRSGTPPEILTFLSGGSEWLTGDVFQDRKTTLILDRLLVLFHAWRYCFIWKRIPPWDYSDTDTAKNCLSRQLVHSLVPQGFSGAIKISRDGIGPMLQLVLAQALLGVTRYDDIFVIPDDARYVVWVDHHAEVHVQCAHRGDLPAVSEMLDLGDL